MKHRKKLLVAVVGVLASVALLFAQPAYAWDEFYSDWSPGYSDYYSYSEDYYAPTYDYYSYSHPAYDYGYPAYDYYSYDRPAYYAPYPRYSSHYSDPYYPSYSYRPSYSNTVGGAVTGRLLGAGARAAIGAATHHNIGQSALLRGGTGVLPGGLRAAAARANTAEYGPDVEC